MRKAIFLGLVLTVIISISCSIQQSHLPSAIIYKTKADYTKYVPVTLSEDKSHIISYPAPQDVFYQGKLALPTELSGGYLLDNRGITPNSAFIKITYEDFAKLSQVPSTESLYALIIDKTPFKAIYDMGPRNHYQDPVREIDSIIRHHHLKDYKKIL